MNHWRPTPKARALFEAIYRVDVAEVRRLLDTGVDPNAVFDGTALEYAAGRDSLPLVQLLLEKGAKVPPYPMCEAAGGETLDVPDYFLSFGANINELGGWESTALDVAAAEGNETMVRWLLSHGATLMHPDTRARIEQMLGALPSAAP